MRFRKRKRKKMREEKVYNKWRKDLRAKGKK